MSTRRDTGRGGVWLKLLTDLLTDGLISGVIHRADTPPRFDKRPVQRPYLIFDGTSRYGLERLIIRRSYFRILLRPPSTKPRFRWSRAIVVLSSQACLKQEVDEVALRWRGGRVSEGPRWECSGARRATSGLSVTMVRPKDPSRSRAFAP